MIEAKITVIHAMNCKPIIKLEPSIFAQDDMCYFTPEGVGLETCVSARTYNELRNDVDYLKRSFIARLKFLFTGDLDNV